MTSYIITLINEDKDTKMSISCSQDFPILLQASQAGITLPFSCNAGQCSSCAGILVDGIISQNDQGYLTDNQIDNKWVLTCVAYPRSDCIILTNKEYLLYQ